jgi:hypothetical protein
MLPAEEVAEVVNPETAVDAALAAPAVEYAATDDAWVVAVTTVALDETTCAAPAGLTRRRRSDGTSGPSTRFLRGSGPPPRPTTCREWESPDMSRDVDNDACAGPEKTAADRAPSAVEEAVCLRLGWSGC